MTFLDWLWDWRTLSALALGDAVLLAAFFAWDAKHLAFLTLLARQPGGAARGSAGAGR
jgi:hypothetical protein